jgi:hypothetical protein
MMLENAGIEELQEEIKRLSEVIDEQRKLIGEDGATGADLVLSLREKLFHAESEVSRLEDRMKTIENAARLDGRREGGIFERLLLDFIIVHDAAAARRVLRAAVTGETLPPTSIEKMFEQALAEYEWSLYDRWRSDVEED